MVTLAQLAGIVAFWAAIFGGAMVTAVGLLAVVFYVFDSEGDDDAR